MIQDSIFKCLRDSKLFQGLSNADIEEIKRSLAIAEKKYSKHENIINQGELIKMIGILNRGNAISVKYHLEGTTQILRIYNEGEVFSLDTVNTLLSKSPTTLISQTDASVVFIPYEQIFELDEISQEAKKTILTNGNQILSNEVIRLTYKIDVLSKRTIREKILTYLRLICERYCSSTVNIGMNQEQFAQYLCVNRSVLSKELSRMREAGLIDYRGSQYTVY